MAPLCRDADVCRHLCGRRKHDMEEMYEVLKFIEHGTQCRQSMDCERGDLLIYYLRDNPRMEKEVLFGWFRQIGLSLHQFQRCRAGRRYRYLNPYSIVVGENGKVYLLDLDAPENESVMKKMQNRAVRRHFMKADLRDEPGRTPDADLFGYGKTMQFALAYTAVVPCLTRREEKKLARVIERCTESTAKRYADVRQAAEDIPAAARQMSFTGFSFRKAAAAAGCLGLLARLSVLLPEPEDHSGSWAEEELHSEESVKTENSESPGSEDQKETEETGTSAGKGDVQTDEEYISGAGRILREYLLQNTDSGNKQALLLGKEMELNAVRSLAAVYEREEMVENAVLAYGRLIEIEEGAEQIETAAEKKMKLEAAQGQYAQAVLTGEEALSRAENSLKILDLIEKYKEEQNGEEQKQEVKEPEEGDADEQKK